MVGKGEEKNKRLTALQCEEIFHSEKSEKAKKEISNDKAEEQILNFLKKYKSSYAIEEIKQIIYNEEDHEELTALFPRVIQSCQKEPTTATSIHSWLIKDVKISHLVPKDLY